MDKAEFTKKARLAKMEPIKLEDHGLEGDFFLRPLTGIEIADAKPRWRGIEGQEKALIEEMNRLFAMSLCDEDGVNIYELDDPEVATLPRDLIAHVAEKAMDFNGITAIPAEEAENLSGTPGD